MFGLGVGTRTTAPMRSANRVRRCGVAAGLLLGLGLAPSTAAEFTLEALDRMCLVYLPNSDLGTDSSTPEGSRAWTGYVNCIREGIDRRIAFAGLDGPDGKRGLEWAEATDALSHSTCEDRDRQEAQVARHREEIRKLYLDLDSLQGATSLAAELRRRVESAGAGGPALEPGRPIDEIESALAGALARAEAAARAARTYLEAAAWYFVGCDREDRSVTVAVGRLTGSTGDPPKINGKKVSPLTGNVDVGDTAEAGFDEPATLTLTHFESGDGRQPVLVLASGAKLELEELEVEGADPPRVPRLTVSLLGGMDVSIPSGYELTVRCGTQAQYLNYGDSSAARLYCLLGRRFEVQKLRDAGTVYVFGTGGQRHLREQGERTIFELGKESE